MTLSLQQLSDRIELQDLVTEYANALDAREFDRMDRVFLPNAYIDYRAMGGIDGPYPKVKAWLPEALKHFPSYMHLVGNFHFKIDGDTATGRIACFNPMVVPKPDGSGTETMFLGLWYIDRYQRTAEGWRIVERSEQHCYDHGMPEWMKKALKMA